MKKLILLLTVVLTTIMVVPADANYMFRDPGKEEGTYVYRVYIDHQIAKPSRYRRLFNLLEYVTKKDKVIFIVNSYGGYANTGILLYNRILKCKAKTVADVTVAMSAATFIVMACDKVKVNDGAKMMFHNLQLYGLGGDSERLKTATKFLDDWNEKFLKQVYNNFLSFGEIVRMLNGKEIWLNDDQIRKRCREQHKLIN